MPKRVVDFLIIGNGTAGAVLGRKLSDDLKTRVVILEAGVNHNNDPVVTAPIPSTSINPLGTYPQYSLTYNVDTFIAGYTQLYTIGCGWGGSSMHNYLITVRGTPYIYDTWAQRSGRQDWSYNAVLPLMKYELEDYVPEGTTLDPAQRGTTGPLAILQLPPVNTDPFSQDISAAWANLPFVDDYNDPTQGTVSISAEQAYLAVSPTFEVTRSFSQTAYIIEGQTVDANGKGLGGRKLQIISSAFVNRVLFKHKSGCASGSSCASSCASPCSCTPRAIGVEYCVTATDGTERIKKIYAKTVILSAGSVNSPAILERSGIGDPAILSTINVPVMISNTNVGNNGQNQYGVKSIMSGPIAPDAVYMAFTDGRPLYPATGYRVFQVFPESFGDPSNIVTYAAILEPKSISTVHCVSNDPKVQPQVQLNFYTDGPVTQSMSDANKSVTMYKLLQIVATQIGGTMVYPPPSDFASDDTLLADAINWNGMFIEDHLCCTTRMAKTAADGVVDGHLRVFGTKGLYVCDNGVAPISNNGNTSYTAYVLGLRLSKDLNERKCKNNC